MDRFIKIFPSTFLYIENALTEDKQSELYRILKQTEQECPLVKPKQWTCDVLTTFDYQNIHLNNFIKNEFTDYITAYLREEHGIESSSDTTMQAWINKYSQNQYQEIHRHLAPSVILCGIYILQQEQNSTSPLQFFDPNKTFKESCGIRTIVEKPNFKNNNLILFPPYIEHYVEKVKTNTDRITISFNLRLANNA